MPRDPMWSFRDRRLREAEAGGLLRLRLPTTVWAPSCSSVGEGGGRAASQQVACEDTLKCVPQVGACRRRAAEVAAPACVGRRVVAIGAFYCEHGVQVRRTVNQNLGNVSLTFPEEMVTMCGLYPLGCVALP